LLSTAYVIFLKLYCNHTDKYDVYPIGTRFCPLKGQDSKKAGKKAPAKTLKEKRTDKKTKKNRLGIK